MARRDEGDSYEGNSNDRDDLDSMNVRKKRPEEHIPAWLAFCLILLYYAIRVSLSIFCLAIELYVSYHYHRYANSVQSVEKVAETPMTVSETVSQPAEEEDDDVPGSSSVHPLEIKDSVTASDSTAAHQPVETVISDPTTTTTATVEPSLDVTEVSKKDRSRQLVVPVAPTAEGAEDQELSDENTYSASRWSGNNGSPPLPVKGPPDKISDQNKSQESQQQRCDLRQETMEESKGDQCLVASSKQSKVDKSAKASKSQQNLRKLSAAKNKQVFTFAQTEHNDLTEQPSSPNANHPGQSSGTGIQEMEQASGYEVTGGQTTVPDRDRPGMVAGVQDAEISLGAPNESSESPPVNCGTVDSINSHG